MYFSRHYAKIKEMSTILESPDKNVREFNCLKVVVGDMAKMSHHYLFQAAL